MAMQIPWNRRDILRRFNLYDKGLGEMGDLPIKEELITAPAARHSL
jgi:hypothetical protein